LESISFRTIVPDDADAVLEIINYYITNSTYYFAETALEVSAISGLMNDRSMLPKYVVEFDGNVIGFGYAYNFRPESTFAETVKLTYWLKNGFTRKGIGGKLYDVLEQELIRLKISSILVNISSDNVASLEFHKRRGYMECGNFKRAGYKNDRYFDLIWMQKFLA